MRRNEGILCACGKGILELSVNSKLYNWTINMSRAQTGAVQDWLELNCFDSELFEEKAEYCLHCESDLRRTTLYLVALLCRLGIKV